MTTFRTILLAVLMAALTCVLLYAADDGYVQRDQVPGNGIKIGSDGTWTKLLHAGHLSIDAAKTSNTVTLASVSVGDIAVVSPNGSLGNATKFHAACTTTTLKIDVNTSPGSAVRFNYIVIGKP